MKYFTNLAQFRQLAADVSYLPDKKMTWEVFSLVAQTYMKDWYNPIRLCRDVSPDMLEACFSKIFGTTLMKQITECLQVIEKKLKDEHIDDLWLALIRQRHLLVEIARESKWNIAATKDVNRLAFLIFCLLDEPSYMPRFMGQATKRIAFSNQATK